MELIKDSIKYYEPIISKTAVYDETADMIVPDSYPDILRVLCAYGNAVIKDKNAQSDRVMFSGTIKATVLYVPEDGSGIYSLQVPVNFAHIEDGRGVSAESEVFVQASVRNIEARMMNPRKISVRAYVTFDTKAYKQVEAEITTDVSFDNSEGIQCLKSSYDVKTLSAVASKNFSILEDIALPKGIPAARQILKNEVSINTDDMKLLNNKAIVKGSADVKVLYITKEEGAIASHTFPIYFSQVLDIDGVDEQSQANIDYCIKDASFVLTDADGEGRIINANMDIEAFSSVYKNQQFDALTDMYSTSHPVSIETVNQNFRNAANIRDIEMDIIEKIEVGTPVRSVIDFTTGMGLPTIVQTDNGQQVQTDLYIDIVFEDQNGDYYATFKRIPVSMMLDDTVSDNARILAEADDVTLSIDGQGNIDLTATIEFTIIGNDYSAVRQIQTASLDESVDKNTDNDLSMVLKYVSNDEGLWDIAKRYNTTLEEIMEANSLTDEDNIEAGKMLLIPLGH